MSGYRAGQGNPTAKKGYKGRYNGKIEANPKAKSNVASRYGSDSQERTLPKVKPNAKSRY